MGFSRRSINKHSIPYLFKVKLGQNLSSFFGVRKRSRFISYRRFLIRKKIKKFIKLFNKINKKTMREIIRFYSKRNTLCLSKPRLFRKRIILKTFKKKRGNKWKRRRGYKTFKKKRGNKWKRRRGYKTFKKKFQLDLTIIKVNKKKSFFTESFSRKLKKLSNLKKKMLYLTIKKILFTKFFNKFFFKKKFFFSRYLILLKRCILKTFCYIKLICNFCFENFFNWLRFYNVLFSNTFNVNKSKFNNNFLNTLLLNLLLKKTYFNYKCLKVKYLSKRIYFFNNYPNKFYFFNLLKPFRFINFKKLYFWRFFFKKKSLNYFYFLKNRNNFKKFSRRRLFKRNLGGFRFIRKRKIRFLLKRFFSIQKKIITTNPARTQRRLLKFIKYSKRRFFRKRIPFYPFSLDFLPSFFVQKKKMTFNKKFKKFHVLFRLFYRGMSASKLWRLVRFLKKYNRNTLYNYISLFELRLDVLLFRLNLVKSIQEGFILVKQGLITINGKCCFLPHYVINKNDIIMLANKNYEYKNECQKFFLNTLEKLLYRLPVRFQFPKYFEFNFKYFAFVFLKNIFSLRFLRFFPFNYRMFRRFKFLMNWGKYSLRV